METETIKTLPNSIKNQYLAERNEKARVLKAERIQRTGWFWNAVRGSTKRPITKGDIYRIREAVE